MKNPLQHLVGMPGGSPSPSFNRFKLRSSSKEEDICKSMWHSLVASGSVFLNLCKLKAKVLPLGLGFTYFKIKIDTPSARRKILESPLFMRFDVPF